MKLWALNAALVQCLRALCLAAPQNPRMTPSILPGKRHSLNAFGGLQLRTGPLAFALGLPATGLGHGFFTSATKIDSAGKERSAQRAVTGAKMMSGWRGGSAANRGARGSAGKRQWDSGDGDEGGRGDGGGWRGSRDRDGARSSAFREGSEGNRGGRRGGFREGGREGGGRGWSGGNRDDRPGRASSRGSDWNNEGGSYETMTREELWEKQRERQAVQAERQSWLQEQNQRFPNSEYIFGVAPVLAALRTKRRLSHVLYVQETMDMDKRKDRSAAEEIQKLAAECCIIQNVDKGRLNVMSGDRPHQGFILQCEPLDFLDINQMEPEPGYEPDAAPTADTKTRPPVWLVLDEVMDPQNFGALVRSAYFLGCGGVVTCARNSANLSPVMSKASAGAVELQPVYSTKNLMRFLEASKKNGWQVIGAALSRESVAAASMTLSKPTLLVLGNEGRGLRTNVLRCCDLIVQIEGGRGENQGSYEDGDDEVLDSLNVSVAGGILLHRLLCSKV